MSKYVNFVSFTTTGKDEVYEVVTKSNDYTLGYIKWYSKWQQYCFFPESHATFTNVYLDDIIKFMENLAERKPTGSKRIGQLKNCTTPN